MLASLVGAYVHIKDELTLVLYLSANRPTQSFSTKQSPTINQTQGSYYLAQSIRHKTHRHSIKLAQSLDCYTDDSSSLIKTSRQLLSSAFLQAYQVQLNNLDQHLEVNNLKHQSYIEQAIADIYPIIPWRKASLLALDLEITVN